MTQVIYIDGALANIAGAGIAVMGTPASVPAQMQTPTHFNISNPGTGGTLNIDVGALPYDNGSAINDIKYRVDGGSWTSVTSYSGVGTYAITGLTNGVQVFVEVIASNAIGDQLDSPQGLYRTPTAAASVPATIGTGDWSVADTGNGGQVRLIISNAPDDGGDAITDYQYRIDAGTAVSLGAIIGTFDIGGLTNTVSYDFEVRAVNSQGNGAWSAVKAATPTLAGAGGGYTPDATASTAAGITSQLSAWSGGSGIKYLQVTANISAAITCNGYSFPDGVIVYGQGENCSITLTGAVTISNCSNLNFEFFTVQGVTTNIDKGSSNCLMRYCVLQGTATPGTKAGGFGLYVRQNGGAYPDGCGAVECLFQRWSSNQFKALNANNVVCQKNGFDEPGQDNLSLADVDGVLCDRNWFHTTHLNPAGGHLDDMQGFGAGNNGLGVRNAVFIGNVALELNMPNTQTGPFSHGIFLSTTSNHDATCTDNFIVVTNQNGLIVQGSVPTAANNNAVLILNESGMNGGAAQNTRAYITLSATGSTATDNIERRPSQGEGGSLLVTTGDYDTYWGALKQGGDSWNTLGIGGDFSDAYPKTGTVAHWDNGAPVGPYSRLKEIFISGIHPGNSINPNLASWWDATYNKHARITS